jgi:hypothetical protein
VVLTLWWRDAGVGVEKGGGDDVTINLFYCVTRIMTRL